MKIRSNPSRKSVYINEFKIIQKIRNQGKKTYTPKKDSKGIHCDGEKFGFVVSWEVREADRKLITSE